MAGVDIGGGGKKGKKPLDVSIPVIPIIDLMAVTISFLIMTAVWTQIGRLQVSQAGGPSDSSSEEVKTLPVTLLVTATEARLSVGSAPAEVFPLNKAGTSTRFDLAKLVAKLREVKTSLPDQSNITVQAEDAVRYEDLVHIIDECIGAQFPNVSVQAALG